MQRLAIAGVGLIGGSFALALREAGVGVHVTTPDELRKAMEEAIRTKRPTLVNAVIDEGGGTESGRITSLNPAAKKKP